MRNESVTILFISSLYKPKIHDPHIAFTPKVHISYKEGVAKLRVVFRSAGQHLRNGTN
jgi:hypothetical protein